MRCERVSVRDRDGLSISSSLFLSTRIHVYLCVCVCVCLRCVKKERWEDERERRLERRTAIGCGVEFRFSRGKKRIYIDIAHTAIETNTRYFEQRARVEFYFCVDLRVY